MPVRIVSTIWIQELSGKRQRICGDPSNRSDSPVTEDKKQAQSHEDDQCKRQGIVALE
jgi:hypothetical protein